MLFPYIAWSADNCQQYTSANVRVLVNGKPVLFDQEPIIVEGKILVPLRAIAESLGATVEWDESKIKIKTYKVETVLMIDSIRVYQTDRKIFFMELPPVIINNHLFVPLRFISEILGASLKRDDNNKIINISPNGFDIGVKNEGEKTEDNFYKPYDIVVGGYDVGPSYEEAKQFILEKKLLKSIKDVEYTYISFSESGWDYNTMVIGIDKENYEKAIWLVKNKYTGYIDITGSVYLENSISQETVFSILKNEGIERENIKKIYFAPHAYEKKQIYWFAIVEQGNKTYCYCLDFYTGNVNKKEEIVSLKFDQIELNAFGLT